MNGVIDLEQIASTDAFVLPNELINYYTDLTNLLTSINDTLLLMVIIFGFWFGAWLMYLVLKSIMG